MALLRASDLVRAKGGTTIPTGGRRRRKKSKYGVYLDDQGKADRTYKGKRYKSLRERHYAETLDHLMSAGEVASWSYEPKRFKFYINGHHVTSYTPDFAVRYPDGRMEIHEIKGRETDGFRIAFKCFQADWLVNHPEVMTTIFYLDGEVAWRGMTKVKDTRPKKPRVSRRSTGVALAVEEAEE